ncbi:unnamed protein product [Parajaminaea phylloscopi]
MADECEHAAWQSSRSHLHEGHAGPSSLATRSSRSNSRVTDILRASAATSRAPDAPRAREHAFRFGGQHGEQSLQEAAIDVAFSQFFTDFMSRRTETDLRSIQDRSGAHGSSAAQYHQGNRTDLTPISATHDYAWSSRSELGASGTLDSRQHLASPVEPRDIPLEDFETYDHDVTAGPSHKGDSQTQHAQEQASCSETFTGDTGAAALSNHSGKTNGSQGDCATVEPVRRRRGRPKGSKTRPELLALKAQQRALLIGKGLDGRSTPAGRAHGALRAEHAESAQSLRRGERRQTSASATGYRPLFQKRKYIRRKPLEECRYGRKQSVSDSPIADVAPVTENIVTLLPLIDDWRSISRDAEHFLPVHPECHSYYINSKRGKQCLASATWDGGTPSYRSDDVPLPLDREPKLSPWLSTSCLPFTTVGAPPAPTLHSQTDLLRMQWLRRCGRASPPRTWEHDLSIDGHQRTPAKLDLRRLWQHAVRRDAKGSDQAAQLSECDTPRGRLAPPPVFLARNTRWAKQTTRVSVHSEGRAGDGGTDGKDVRPEHESSPAFPDVEQSTRPQNAI